MKNTATNTPIGAKSPLNLNGLEIMALEDGRETLIAEVFEGHKDAKANARHIVHCVNNFDGLVKTLEQGEDIISGLEAEADNAGINLEEVRAWWVDAQSLLIKAKGGE